MKKTISLTIAVISLVALSISAFAGSDGSIDEKLIKQFRQGLEDDKSFNRIVNAVTNNDIKSLSLNRQVVAQYDDQFNVKLKGSKIINQKSSGRCWMFAGANTLTPKVMTKLQLSDFKLSEAYLAFWDKMEKSNRFLETIIALRDKPLDDRSLQMYIEGPMGDGGWWHYFTGLIAKYGIVPASAMQETKQSSTTARLNKLANTLLRKGAARIRELHQQGKSETELRKYKEEALDDMYKLLIYSYGQPPEQFVFRYEEGEDSVKTLIEKRFTPKSFYAEFYSEDMPEYVAIVNNPTMDFDKLYELETSRNIFEDDDLRVLNLPIERLKEYSFKALMDSQIVWFACDVGKDNFNDSGMFAVNIYDYSSTFDLDFGMSKADRINFMDMSPNHAMVLTGVDTSSAGTPRKWLVENSWGTKKGNDGYWTMYDSWFDEYVLLVIVDKRLLDPEDAARFADEPIKIADWQPFFAALTRLR